MSINNNQKNRIKPKLLREQKTEALLVFIRTTQEQNWIPEQLVICLLSEWILEEEKSTILYPFLKDIDYTSLLSLYDKVIIQAKKDEDWNKTLAVKTMYKVASELIQRLKNTTYKVNTKRVSKSRKKRRKVRV